MTDALDDFTRSELTHRGVTHEVLRKGTGPAVIVIHELPGLTPSVAAFGRRVADHGFTAVMPVLFGEVGRPMSVGYVAREIARVCVSREFHAFARQEGNPVTAWLLALAREAHEQCGGPGVGALGMCFTGGFALAMSVDPTVVAPVLSQPSLPFPVGTSHKRALNLSDTALDLVKARTETDGLCLLGFRFSEDRGSPPERFARLREEFGASFIGVEIDSSPGNAAGISKAAHSVLTEHFVDEPGHPTRAALDQVLAFLTERLRPA
jgi:dienelactone hydrolase